MPRPTRPFLLALAVLLTAVAVELVLVLRLNHGMLVYTLDDAYIHLALGESILRAHYGVNVGEASAPSSSIIWPFIIAPFASSPFGEYVPLLVNIACAVATLALFARIVSAALGHAPRQTMVAAWLLVVLIVCTNLVGLVFTGMEHSLQVLTVVAIAWGLIAECETGRRPGWLFAAIVAAPLVRYENVGVSLAAIVYVFGRGLRAAAATATIAIGLLLAGFSAFLVAQGLGSFPTSVLAKSSVVGTGGTVASIVGNLRVSLDSSRGAYLIVAFTALWGYAAFSDNKRRGWLAATSSLAILAHLAVGRYGYYNRYEIYVWSFCLSVLLYLAGSHLRSALESGGLVSRLKLMGVTGAAVLLVCSGYVRGLRTLPWASNNIYQQQFQMHRFAADFYRQPVAVNDLGYVSYRNENYVLDLWGLASLDALAHRQHSRNAEWMNQLARSKGVGVAMIYDDWFGGVIPAQWIRLGRLHLGGTRVTAAEDVVTFYATGRESYGEAVEAVRRFAAALPREIQFTLDSNSAAQGTDATSQPLRDR
jgi:hypothetical protein